MKRMPLRRSRKPIARRAPLRSWSHRPGWRQARSFVKGRADGRCEASLPCCVGRGAHAHHIQMRSQGGTDEPGNLLWVCALCHARIHDNPAESYAAGLLRRRAA